MNERQESKGGLRSTDVRDIYDAEYFLNRVDGFDRFDQFDGTPPTLFDRARRNFELLSLEAGEYLLDIGCGRGEVVITAGLAGVHAIGCDFSPAALDLANAKLREIECRLKKSADVLFVRSSATEVEFVENSFDKVLLSEFIEHLSKREAAIVLRRVYRWLKPGGTVVIFTGPNRWNRKVYPMYRVYARLLKGIVLPPTPGDTTHPDYDKLHLNEQTWVSLWWALRTVGFSRVRVWFDVNPPASVFSRIIWKLGAKYLFGTNLVGMGIKS